MKTIKITKPQEFVQTFLDEYLENGLGAKTKRDIDILVMYLLMEYGGLSNMSNHDLSILLQTTESRIKSLRYEARLKYPPDDDYVKREFLCLLGQAQFELDKKEEKDISKMKIVFIMEDDFLRHSIQGRLKKKGMFADTSFNSEIVKIECDSLVAVIAELYDQETADQFREGFETLEGSKKGEGLTAFKDVMIKFVLDTAKSVFTAIVAGEIKSRLGLV